MEVVDAEFEHSDKKFKDGLNQLEDKFYLALKFPLRSQGIYIKGGLVRGLFLNWNETVLSTVNISS
jgi:hypothetical protein